MYTLNDREGFLSAIEVYTLNDQEKHSRPLRVYTLNGREKPLSVVEGLHPRRPGGFLSAVEVYILDGRGFSRPSRVCHQRPGGILPAAGGFFWLACNPQNPTGFWGIDSVPRRGLDYFLFKFIGESTPKPADRFGGSTPKFGGFGGLGVDSPILGSRLAKPLFFTCILFTLLE